MEDLKYRVADDRAAIRLMSDRLCATKICVRCVENKATQDIHIKFDQHTKFSKLQRPRTPQSTLRLDG